MDVKAVYSVENNKIKSFKVVQTFCEHADEVYKSHKMNIALYYEKEVKFVQVIVEAKNETDLTSLFCAFNAPKAV